MIYRERQTTFVLAALDGNAIIVDELNVFEVIVLANRELYTTHRETIYVPNPIHQGRPIKAIVTMDAKVFTVMYQAGVPSEARVMPRDKAHRLAMVQLATAESRDTGSTCEVCGATGDMCPCPTCTQDVCSTHLSVLVQCSTCRELREQQLHDLRDIRAQVDANNIVDAATQPPHERTGAELSGGA